MNHTDADWRSLAPTFDADGKLISVKAGATELMTTQRAIHNFQQLSIDASKPAVLTPSQEERYRQIGGHVPKPVDRFHPAHHVDEVPVNGVDQREVVHEEKVRMESEEQWSVDHEEVGTRVAEMFEGKMFGGTIDRVLLAHTDADGDEIPTIYHVRYDDNDEAELEGEDALQHGKDMAHRLPISRQRHNQPLSARSPVGERQSNTWAICMSVQDYM